MKNVSRADALPLPPHILSWTTSGGRADVSAEHGVFYGPIAQAGCASIFLVFCRQLILSLIKRYVKGDGIDRARVILRKYRTHEAARWRRSFSMDEKAPASRRGIRFFAGNKH
jgi:hypothetical protein